MSRMPGLGLGWGWVNSFMAMPAFWGHLAAQTKPFLEQVEENFCLKYFPDCWLYLACYKLKTWNVNWGVRCIFQGQCRSKSAWNKNVGVNRLKVAILLLLFCCHDFVIVWPTAVLSDSIIVLECKLRALGLYLKGQHCIWHSLIFFFVCRCVSLLHFLLHLVCLNDTKTAQTAWLIFSGTLYAIVVKSGVNKLT